MDSLKSKLANYSKSYFKLDSNIAPFKVQRVNMKTTDNKGDDSKSISRLGKLHH